MIDVCIIASGSAARLLAMECERMGLEAAVSDTPIPSAKIFICCDSPRIADSLPQERVISLEFPFLLDELRAMMTRTVLNNSKPQAPPAPKQRKAPSVITLDKKTKSARLRGTEIPLSPTEYAILDLLLSKKGEIVDYSEINRLIGGAGSNKINVYVCHLRKKLEAYGDKIIYGARQRGFYIKK